MSQSHVAVGRYVNEVRMAKAKISGQHEEQFKKEKQIFEFFS